MKLKNYTSETPADTSVLRIERQLIEIGASDINKNYSGGKLAAIKFLIVINGTTVVFHLKARVEAVFKALWSEVKRPQPGTKERVMQQAERTSWKLLADWVDVQASMIYLEQAEVLQVFLPWAVVGPDETLYDRVSKGDFKLLQAPR